MVAGLAKSDVEALREATRAGAPHSLRGSVSLDQVTNLLTVWHTHSGFSGRTGSRWSWIWSTPGSPRHSFRELIAAACPGADEEAVLDELVAAGSVEVIDGITVRCLSRAYVPKGADVKRIERMGRFLAVVSANFVHNLLRMSPEPVYFERTVVSDELISEAGRDRFLALAGERGQELLTELDSFLTSLAAKERSESGKRYGVGVYFFEDVAHDESTDVRPEDGDQEKNAGTTSPLEEIDVLAGLGRKK